MAMGTCFSWRETTLRLQIEYTSGWNDICERSIRTKLHVQISHLQARPCFLCARESALDYVPQRFTTLG